MEKKVALMNTRIILVIVFSLLSDYSIAAVSNKPFVVPELKEWVSKEGYFALNENSKIVYNQKQPELLLVARQFADDYFQLFKRRIEVVCGSPKSGDIGIALKKDKELGEEEYSIQISDRIQISASEVIGTYWGTRTLLQIAEQSAVQEFPKGVIRDYPDYKLRGVMIDCGRKFIPLSYLRDLVKVMSYYKMNTLQVHLNDNGFKQYFEHNWDKTYAAFRLESDTYPGLAAFDGYYTKKEFINFQKEAMRLGVEIIPEIDVPAHSLPFTHYMPEIGSREYGMDHLDLFTPQTYRFLDDLFKEYLEGDESVFCGRRVHIGTDEYSNEKQEVVEKFRAFTDHYIRLVESYGKQACLWGALTHAKGTTPVKSENVIMSAWSLDYANPEEMIHQGYQLVNIPDHLLYIVPGAPYYHDYLKEEMLYSQWTPGHLGKKKEQSSSILGGMFALWNDHVGNGISVKDIHYRLFPALQTLSVKMWTGENTTLSYSEFDRSRVQLSEAPGVNQRGRVGKTPSLVYETSTLSANSKTELLEIGYNYTVSFELSGKEEAPGTALFSSPNSIFYLSDPIRGFFGFARDGYLNTFRYKVREGQKAHIQIEGDHRSTTLKVNGKMVDSMDIQMFYYNGGKDSLEYIRTFVFPLEESGPFKSRVDNLKVFNYIVK